MKVKVEIRDRLLEQFFGIKQGDIVTARYEIDQKQVETSRGRIYHSKGGYLCRTEQNKDIVIYKSECTPVYDHN